MYLESTFTKAGEQGWSLLLGRVNEFLATLFDVELDVYVPYGSLGIGKYSINITERNLCSFLRTIVRQQCTIYL